MAEAGGPLYTRLLDRLVEDNNGPRDALIFAWDDIFPFTDGETSKCMSKIADLAVMGLLALTTLSASYVVYWAKPGSTCVPPVSDGSMAKSWQQILFGALPFIVFPLTVILSGLARGAEENSRALSLVATLCLWEVIFALFVGGGMTICMGLSMITVGGVIFTLTVLIVAGWATAFKYPKGIRHCIWVKCFCQSEDSRGGPPILPV